MIPKYNGGIKDPFLIVKGIFEPFLISKLLTLELEYQATQALSSLAFHR